MIDRDRPRFLKIENHMDCPLRKSSVQRINQKEVLVGSYCEKTSIECHTIHNFPEDCPLLSAESKIGQCPECSFEVSHITCPECKNFFNLPILPMIGRDQIKEVARIMVVSANQIWHDVLGCGMEQSRYDSLWKEYEEYLESELRKIGILIVEKLEVKT